MSDAASIEDILQRVEQMLDTLDVLNQSSKEFRDGCDQIDLYLNDQKAFLMSDSALFEPHKSRVVAIIQRLAGLQKRAEIRANIPTALQKYIAEQLD